MTPPTPHTGDDGTTGLLGSGRLPKHHLQIETLGTLDEASAALGLARASTHNPLTATLIKDIQRDLYTLMAEIAASPAKGNRIPRLTQSRLDWLESKTSTLEEHLPQLRAFILPGDSFPGAAFSLARTVVRRAERRVSQMISDGSITSPIILPYLNRLSSLCFLLERSEDISASGASSLAKK